MATRKDLDRIEEEIQDEELKIAFIIARDILTYRNPHISGEELLKRAKESVKEVREQGFSLETDERK